MKEKISNNIQIKNKRATFDFELLDTFTAGIVLTGTEIKSIRLGKASLVDTCCIMERGELWVKNMYVAEYFYGTYNNHVARRDRKLLLTKKELRKIDGAARNSGFTIIPTRMFINEKGLAKVDVKRNTISATRSRLVTISGKWTDHSSGKIWLLAVSLFTTKQHIYD